MRRGKTRKETHCMFFFLLIVHKRLRIVQAGRRHVTREITQPTGSHDASCYAGILPHNPTRLWHCARTLKKKKSNRAIMLISDAIAKVVCLLQESKTCHWVIRKTQKMLPHRLQNSGRSVVQREVVPNSQSGWINNRFQPRHQRGISWLKLRNNNFDLRIVRVALSLAVCPAPVGGRIVIGWGRARRRPSLWIWRAGPLVAHQGHAAARFWKVAINVFGAPVWALGVSFMWDVLIVCLLDQNSD